MNNKKKIYFEIGIVGLLVFVGLVSLLGNNKKNTLPTPQGLSASVVSAVDGDYIPAPTNLDVTVISN